MKSVSIQIIEGNPHLRSLISWHLQQVGYSVYQCNTIAQSKDVFLSKQPNLIIIDSDLPDGDGLELCRWFQDQRYALILILSARNTENDIVTGLQAGADDYITKPFGMQEFLARVEALFRRMRVNSHSVNLDYGDLKIDLIHRNVMLKNEFIELTPQEFSLLYVLAQAGGIALSRSELLRKAWPDSIDNHRTIDTHILSLRKKIEIDPKKPILIQTVRNIGYRFNPDFMSD